MTGLLAAFTTLGVGGPAGRVVECATTDHLVETVRDCDVRGEPLLVLGGGSNVLVSDAGFAGTVVLVRTSGLEISELGCGSTPVQVEAGADWDTVVVAAIDAGLAGIECLSGIPGSTGATPVQNVGAYGQEVGTTVARVRTYDRTLAKIRTFAAADCAFGYRTSRFKQERAADGGVRYVVLDVELALRNAELSEPVTYAELAQSLGVAVGGRAPLPAVRLAVLALRRSKGMVLDAADADTRSAGSFFTNPVLNPAAAAALPADAPRWALDDGTVKTSAAWLIEHAGFARGHGEGAARLSGKHTLAVTNRGGATAADLLALAREVRDGVRQAFGVTLDAEPQLVGLTL